MSLAQTDITQLRTAMRLTQQQFATMLRVSTVTVSRWETGKSAPEGYSVIVLRSLIEIAGQGVSPVIVTQQLAGASDKTQIVTRLLDIQRAA